MASRSGITFRKIINTVHLWMGLGSGIILFVVCLSGTVYTFRAEIERWVEPGKYYAASTRGIPLAADKLITQLEAGQGGKVTGLTIPAAKSMNWLVTLKKETPEGKKDGQDGKSANAPKAKTYFVDPYTGRIAGEQGGKTSEFFTKVMRLHRWLLMEDAVGRVIVGTATIIFFFIILSGLILWFPAKIRNWKQGLKIKTGGSWKRTNHDLHNSLGFYASCFLLVMCLTGLCWSFEWYKDGLGNVLGAKVFRGRGEKPMASPSIGVHQASVADYLSQADRLFSYPGNLRLTLPEDSAGAVVVTKNATGFFAVAGTDKVQYDRFNAAVLKVERFSDKPLNVQIADSIKPLHTGEMFGTFSKIIYFIACLIATSLPVTGTMIWLNKKKKKNVKLQPERAQEFA